ncbi:Cyclin-related, putative isoform 2 [Hibiscus syriacus]|uniref:Cyclin-related, putative isoform 2 n=1 Tax=Hibiscus syriacus TaxID=106335 RepID=A0A6A2WHH9_HIBSY|nr:Cyclin-related, putative isoform 2 [Hibiscus syriacus]
MIQKEAEAGVVSGPSLLFRVEKVKDFFIQASAAKYYQFFSLVCRMLFMFSIGLETDVPYLKRNIRIVFDVTKDRFAFYLLTLTVLTNSASPIVIRMIADTKFDPADLGRMAIYSSLVNEMSCVIIVSTLGAFTSSERFGGAILITLVTVGVGYTAIFCCVLVGLMFPREGKTARTLLNKLTYAVNTFILPNYFGYTGSQLDVSDSDSRRHHPRLDYEPSPKRSRRDGKPQTERVVSNTDVGDKPDRDEKQLRRLQDDVPLEAASTAPDSSKIGSAIVSEESDRKNDRHHEGTKHSSDPTDLPCSGSYFQHDERRCAAQDGQSYGRRAAYERSDRRWRRRQCRKLINFPFGFFRLSASMKKHRFRNYLGDSEDVDIVALNYMDAQYHVQGNYNNVQVGDLVVKDQEFIKATKEPGADEKKVTNLESPLKDNKNKRDDLRKGFLFPEGYDVEVVCSYHIGSSRHSSDNCKALERRIQNLMDSGA